MDRLPTNFKAIAMGAAVVAILLSTTAPARASVILNGDFETGDFTDWTPVPPPVDSLFFVSGNPHSGQYAAWFGAIGTVDETITQVFETAPGQTYKVEFWLAHGLSDAANDFSAFWNGIQVLSLFNADSFDYTHFSFLETAAGASSTLQFAAREVLDYFFLDDASVNQVIANPEPATLLLLGTGLGAVLRARRQRGLSRLAGSERA